MFLTKGIFYLIFRISPVLFLENNQSETIFKEAYFRVKSSAPHKFFHLYKKYSDGDPN